jgi:predicted GNAT family acetyltransferase
MTSYTMRTRLVPPVGEQDHSQGPANALVTLLEYGDFECPYSRRARPIVQELQLRLGDRMRFVFRNFPLVEIHPHAAHAAEAAEAAAAQGKFWEMYDLLFENQKALEDAELVSYARQAGLDVATFEAAMNDHTYMPHVREDVRGGERSGVRGTPTFFINGFRHDESYDVDTLQTAIEQAEKEKKGSGPTRQDDSGTMAPKVAVTDNTHAHRYEARLNGGLALIEYQREGKRIIYLHTEVPVALEGQGIASALARGALEDARARNLTVVPLCPFVSAYIRRHQEYLPLVDTAYRARLA